jgi:hypothetical protein
MKASFWAVALILLSGGVETLLVLTLQVGPHIMMDEDDRFSF